jgi:enoyl-CoA hydratase/carnithine racemase
MDEAIRVEDSGAVRTITLNRPAKKNAITLAMYAALNAALTEAATDDRTSVVLLGAVGDAFSAGNDIGDFLRASTDGLADNPSARSSGTFLKTIASFPKPMVAAVNGLAIGIGATMLFALRSGDASSARRFSSRSRAQRSYPRRVQRSVGGARRASTRYGVAAARRVN